MQRIRLAILALVAFSCNAYADFRTEVLSVPATDSPASIYAGSTAYNPGSAKSAYVTGGLIGEHIRLQHDPQAIGNPEYYKAKMRDAFNRSIEVADGITYRNDWTDALAKLGIKATVTAITEGATDGGEVSDVLAKKGLDLFSTPGKPMPSSIDFIVAANERMLQNMNNETVLGDLLKETALKFHSDIKGNEALDINPTVRAQMDQNWVKRRLEELGINVENVMTTAANQDRGLQAMDQNVSSELRTLETNFKSLIEQNLDEEKRRQRAEALAARKTETMGALGIQLAIARITGNPGAIAFMEKTGNLVSKAIDTFTSDLKFAKNPAALTNMYVALGMMACDLIAGSQEGQETAVMNALSNIMAELQAIRQQIIDLGTYVEKRLDEIDITLHQYVHDSTLRLEQINSSTRNIGETLSSYKAMLEQIEAHTYGSYVLSSRLAFMDVTDKCFGNNAMTAEDFRKCRNRLGLFAIVGPPLKNTKEQEADSSAIDKLIKRLKKQQNLGVLPVDTRPDPSGWMTAVKSLIRLAKSYPEFRTLLAEPVYSADVDINRSDIVDVARFYQRLSREMALKKEESSGHYSLRSALLSEMIDDYKRGVVQGLQRVDELPGSLLRGAPKPGTSTGQNTLEDKYLYPFLNAGLGFCEPV